MQGNEAPWAERAEGVTVLVRVTPGAAADAIEGTETRADGQTVLKIRVRARPDGGAANREICRVLASALRRPTSSTRVVRGGTARTKTVLVTGDSAELSNHLAVICGLVFS